MMRDDMTFRERHGAACFAAFLAAMAALAVACKVSALLMQVGRAL